MTTEYGKLLLSPEERHEMYRDAIKEEWATSTIISRSCEAQLDKVFNAEWLDKPTETGNWWVSKSYDGKWSNPMLIRLSDLSECRIWTNLRFQKAIVPEPPKES